MIKIVPSVRHSFQIAYNTIKGNTYPLELGYALLSKKLVPTNREFTTNSCIRGCRLYGRNGGCPPFSPSFSEIGGSEILVLYAKISTSYYPHRILHGSYYIRWVFVETILSPFANRLGRRISKTLCGYFISSGHCSACRPRRCAVKDGKNCRNSSERTYSLESTGVLVTKLMEECFDIELQWWRKGEPSYIPGFMVKVVGVTMDKACSSAVTLEVILEAMREDRAVIFDDNNIEL
ncbi:MAG TPA: DUF2284 domain-containing protein [Desulfatiglandales bacterium]|nr:DUF2284 domain-containing protein [Desulfatiglandales bacterium]